MECYRVPNQNHLLYFLGETSKTLETRGDKVKYLAMVPYRAEDWHRMFLACGVHSSQRHQVGNPVIICRPISTCIILTVTGPIANSKRSLIVARP